MTFAAAFTAMEALNWSGAGLKLKTFGARVQTLYPPDLPAVVTELGSGDRVLNSIAIDASKGLASIYVLQALLLSPIAVRPANPLTYLDAYMGLWVGNLALGGALVEPMSIVTCHAGAFNYAGGAYFSLLFLQRWVCEVT